MTERIKVGTRGSRLALAQTDIVLGRLKARNPADVEFEVVEMKTAGDRLQNVPLEAIGGKGVFIKEIEEALLDGRIDMAVHSLKDMPAVIHEELALAAFYKRENPADVLVSRNGAGLEALPQGAVVGTSSLRRAYQLREARPDFSIQPLRGNVNTRLKKLYDGQYDAIVLAAAGLIRLGLEERITEWLPAERFIPSAGQGIIAVETRMGRADMSALLEPCDDRDSRIAALSERAFLRRLNGNCRIPVGAYCTVQGDHIRLWGMLGDPDSNAVYRETAEGRAEEAEALGYLLGSRVMDRMEKEVCEGIEVRYGR